MEKYMGGGKEEMEEMIERRDIYMKEYGKKKKEMIKEMEKLGGIGEEWIKEIEEVNIIYDEKIIDK